jgi:hypothetical protein
VRRLVVTVMVATMLAACGGSAATGSPPPSLASAAASVTPSPSAAPSDSPAPTETASTASPSASSTFLLAGLVANLDVNGGVPDPSTFGTTFPSETPGIYVPYRLAAGLTGKVSSTWTSAGGDTIAASFDYPASAPWAYFHLTYQNGFVPGTHQEVLKFDSTGDSVTLSFTITGPRASPATPTPEPSGASAFTVLQTASAADSSKSAPDPSTYTKTFATSAPAIYVVFTLRSGLTGKVICTMTANGTDLIQPITIDYGTANAWGDFKITPAGSFPAGDYVATVTFTPTGEARTFEFTVQ